MALMISSRMTGPYRCSCSSISTSLTDNGYNGLTAARIRSLPSTSANSTVGETDSCWMIFWISKIVSSLPLPASASTSKCRVPPSEPPSSSNPISFTVLLTAKTGNPKPVITLMLPFASNQAFEIFLMLPPISPARYRLPAAPG